SLHEVHDLVLRPVPIVLAGSRADEAAVPAARGNTEINLWMTSDFRVAEWLRRDERIILRRDNERRHGDAFDDPQRAGALVVIRRASKTEIRGRVCFVEFPHGPDRAELRQIEGPGLRAALPPKPSLQIPDEVPLVEQVIR